MSLEEQPTKSNTKTAADTNTHPHQQTATTVPDTNTHPHPQSGTPPDNNSINSENNSRASTPSVHRCDPTVTTTSMLKLEDDIVVDEKPSLTAFPTMPTLSTPLKRPAPFTVSPTTSKKSSDEADDDDDDEDEEKLSSVGNDIDPERLKAFNMFCRLFVDENLDRLVPISKQPKDKVQAILDACDRQFPEFHDRARKRVRTYLKSCRRMRRNKEMNGFDNFRPTPPHLTSPIAEGLLSQACENETQNAKRIRMGLELITALPTKSTTNQLNAINASTPINASTASTPTLPSSKNTLSGTAVCSSGMPSLIPSRLTQSPNLTSATAAATHRALPDWRFQHAPHFRPDLAPFFTNGFLRSPFPGFPNPLPSAAAAIQASQVVNQLALQQQQSQATDMNNMAKATTPASRASSTPVKGSSFPSNNLSSSEISTIRHLISGYRESATFLYRSADELELLISQSN